MKKTFCQVPGPGETRDCLDPWTFIYVRATGDVDACCRDITIGNLSTGSLAEIVDSPLAVTLREQLLTGKLPPQCVSCSTRGITSTEELHLKLERTLLGADPAEPGHYEEDPYGDTA